MTVIIGTTGKSGIEFEVNLNEHDLMADQHALASNFFIRPHDLSSSKYNHPLSIDFNQLETQKKALWIKYLMDFTPEKRKHARSYKSDSVESTPKLGHKFQSYLHYVNMASYCT